MSRCLLLALATLSITAVPSAAQPARPNVVLIVADDLGGRDLGCYGSQFHRTPHLDQLAKDGVRFTQAYAACPVCSPTRAAIMTGKYPARLRLTDWLPGRGDLPAQKLSRPMIRQELPLEEITLAERLHDAGYATVHVGKWHLGGEGFSPLQQGFDVNIAGDHTGTPLSYFAPFVKNGRTMTGLADAPSGQYLTDRLTTEAERLIDSFGDKPFFLYLPHYAVHTPLMAPQELVDTYPPAGPFTGQQNNPIYAAMLEALDHSVGRITKKLRDLGVLDRTVIVFTSDNGGLATTEGPKTPATSNAPLREGKGWLYEGGIRVPLIIRGPGATAGQVSSNVVCSIDLVPTLCELCGVKLPDSVDGVSVVPSLTLDGKLPDRSLYWHYPHYSNQGGKPGGAVRSGDYKLIEYYENGRRELFNIAKDERENRNRIIVEAAVADQLASELAAWRAAVDAQRMTPNPDYKPNLQLANGRIELPAKTATVHGVMLRYEPLPHKKTLGYWVIPADFATWEFDATRPGTYRLEALVGCGNGSGGSVVHFTIGDQTLALTVKDTGGFQAFQPNDLGTITLDKPGRYELTVKPQSKPGPAVMDLRSVTLVPVGK
ncbi:MAG: sulfatase-like hydrolase/transferase [Planctomycetaceae bacterium]|nr:sulfatase-like hydrolase/transferase [Planctomycetaceae bacterium]